VNLQGSVAIVTGGGTGIGRAVCERLATAGAGAVIVNFSRSVDEAAATVEALEKVGCRAEAARASVADDNAVRAMIGDVGDRYGRVDVLVNNAGTTVYAPFSDLEALTDEVWRELLDVNLLGAFYCARAAGPALREAHGAIVNIASTAAYRAAGSSLAYGVSKAALLQLTRGLARALAPEVRVNAVSPGRVTTRWHSELVGAEKAAEDAESEAGRVPLGQVAGAHQVADAVMGFLEMDLVTGEDLIVDGGKHILY
jgi:3-oxoacyl-[acyl-carrier protein] reductase